MAGRCGDRGGGWQLAAVCRRECGCAAICDKVGLLHCSLCHVSVLRPRGWHMAAACTLAHTNFFCWFTVRSAVVTDSPRASLMWGSCTGLNVQKVTGKTQGLKLYRWWTESQ